MAAFVYDEFDDASIDAAWDIAVGAGSVVEQNDRIEITADDDNQYEFGQNFTVPDFDIWTKVEFADNPPGIGGNVILSSFVWDVSLVDIIQVNLIWNSGTGKYELYYIFFKTGAEQAFISTDLGQNHVWVRLRSRSTDVRGRIYYSLTEPQQDSDWTEIIPTTQFPVFTSSNLYYRMRNFNSHPVQRTGYWWNASEALYPLEPFEFDDFDDNILDSRWDYELGNGSTVEQNERLEITIDAEDEYDFGQTFTEDEIDVWTKVTLPTAFENFTQIEVIDTVSGDYANVELEGDGSGTAFIINMRWKDSVGTADLLGGSISVGSNNSVWMRLRYLPSKGDTYIRGFYALTDPTVFGGGGWIEGARNFPRTPTLANNSNRQEFKTQTDNVTDQTIFWDFALRGRGYRITPDDMNDSSVNYSFWTDNNFRIVTEDGAEGGTCNFALSGAQIGSSGLFQEFSEDWNTEHELDLILRVKCGNGMSKPDWVQRIRVNVFDNDLNLNLSMSWIAGFFSDGSPNPGVERYVIESDYSTDVENEQEVFEVPAQFPTDWAFLRMAHINGELRFLYAPDPFPGSWIDVTPAAVSTFVDLIGGQGSYGWGFDFSIWQSGNAPLAGQYRGFVDFVIDDNEVLLTAPIIRISNLTLDQGIKLIRGG